MVRFFCLLLLVSFFCFTPALSFADDVRDITGYHFDQGCDPNGWCWPSFKLTRKTTVNVETDINKLYPEKMANNAGINTVYAFSLPNLGEVCRIVMPARIPPLAIRQGWNYDNMLAHEARHCMGFDHGDYAHGGGNQ